jgi:malate dehydrogenase
MVPIVRFANVNGIPVTELLLHKYKGDKEKAKRVMEGLVARTQGAGGEVVKLLKDGSAFFSPASSIVTMMEAILQDQKRLMTACAYLTGQFGVYGYYVGVPCVIGADGVEQIVEFNLTDEEKAMFDASVASVKELVDSLPD